MVTTSLPNLAVLEAGGSDAFNRRQLNARAGALCRGESTFPRSMQPMSKLLRVLIVDDDRDTCRSLGCLVQLWGHAGQQAFDGNAALRAAAAEPPDVVLLDIEMPGMNGYEVARRLTLSQCAQVKPLIIAVTGCADEARRQQCREAGIDVVLLKPVDPEVLETLLMLENEMQNLPTASPPAIAVRIDSPLSIGV